MIDQITVDLVQTVLTLILSVALGIHLIAHSREGRDKE